MTWTIKVRGATSGMVTAEYRCPVHGVFEATVWRGPDGGTPDERPCSVVVGIGQLGIDMHCLRSSPWTITSAPLGRVSRASFSRGKSDGSRMATDMDTRALGEGQPLAEWKRERERVWRDVDFKATKEYLR